MRISRLLPCIVACLSSAFAQLTTTSVSATVTGAVGTPVDPSAVAAVVGAATAGTANGSVGGSTTVQVPTPGVVTAPATPAVTVAIPGTTVATPVVIPSTPITPAVTGTVAQPVSSGETSIVLDTSGGIRAVPPSRVTVPTGETLRITGPSFGGRPVQWYKNGVRLAGATTNPLVLTSVTSADAGTYVLLNEEPAVSSFPSQTLVLGVGPVPRLLNISTRAYVGSGEQTFIAGFSVAGKQEKKILIRAVGPTLARYGVTGFLKQPVITLYDGAGNLYTNGYAYLPAVGSLTAEQDIANATSAVGAFPLIAGSKDAVELRPFPAGTYSVHVSSGDGAPGVVLLEVYEVP